MTSTRRELPPPPHWPALMTTAGAASYMSLSEPSFRRLAAKAGLRPVDCNGIAVVRWRRTDVDSLIDRLPPRDANLADAANSEDVPDIDVAAKAAQEALERVRRRAR